MLHASRGLERKVSQFCFAYRLRSFVRSFVSKSQPLRFWNVKGILCQLRYELLRATGGGFHWVELCVNRFRSWRENDKVQVLVWARESELAGTDCKRTRRTNENKLASYILFTYVFKIEASKGFCFSGNIITSPCLKRNDRLGIPAAEEVIVWW